MEGLTLIKDRIRGAFDALGDSAFNWNGCDGLPIRPDVKDYAGILFSALNSIGIPRQLLEDAGMPDLLLNQDGTVDIVFDKPSKNLVLTVECGGVLSFLKTFEDRATEIEGRCREVYPVHRRCVKEVEELFHWYNQE